MAEGIFDFKKFVDDSKNTLTSPKEYFSSMDKEGGFGEPIIKALIYGALAGVFSFLWLTMGFGAAGGMFGSMLGGGIGIMAIIGSLIFAVIGLFIGGIIILIVSAICGGSTDFEANIRVSASIMVLSPISSLLNFTTGLNLYLGAIVTLVILLYGVWLVYNAEINALAGKEGTTKVVSLVLAVIPVLMLLSTLMCASAVKDMTSEKNIEKFMEKSLKNTEMQKRIDELKKAAEKGRKESGGN